MSTAIGKAWRSWGRFSFVLVLEFSLASAVLGGVPSLAAAQTIIVNTLTDKADPPFNADSFCGVGTVANLPATRSLREAIIAANNTPGSQTITFAPALSGGTININFDNLDVGSTPNPLPGICDSDTIINGDINGDGAPDITLNGAALPAGSDGLLILTSRNIMKGLWLKNFPDIGIGIFHATGILSSASQIAENTIQGNVVQGGNSPIFVQAGSTPGFPGKVKNTQILANLVSGAAFRGIQVFTGDAAGSSIDSITIRGNSSSLNSLHGIHLFTNLSSAGSNTSITNASVTDNVVSGNSIIGIVVNPFAGTNNTITGVTLARNTVSGSIAGIFVVGGDTASNGNLVEADIKENTVSGNSNPLTTAGIAVVGGTRSSSGNHVEADIRKNTVTDNIGNGIGVAAGSENSSSNSLDATISGNTVKGNNQDGIVALAGLGAFSLPTGTSNNNTLEVEISGNTVSDHGRSGISVAGGLGSVDGRAGAIANNNQVTAKVNNNTVEDSDIFGIGISGAGSGLANANQVSAQVMKNQACNSGTTDIQVYGGFPGDAFFPPTSGVNNTAQVTATKNTATTLAAANGVAGNFAVLTQSKNVPCP